MSFDRGFDHTHEQTSAGALAEAHLKIQNRRKLELVKHQLMASFGGKMRGEEKISDGRIKSLREQRCGAGYETIQNHRNMKSRRA